MKTQYAHEAERPFLQHWPEADVEVDWHAHRVIAELDDGDEIDSAAMCALVEAFGAGNLSIQAWGNAGCAPRLRIVAMLERDGIKLDLDKIERAARAAQEEVQTVIREAIGK